MQVAGRLGDPALAAAAGRAYLHAMSLVLLTAAGSALVAAVISGWMPPRSSSTDPTGPSDPTTGTITGTRPEHREVGDNRSMTSPTPGLRERKKARTRWTIQEHALRLFADQGYEKTRVDQIAAAAEISPSTFFRYFPTKEDVVVQDEYDDLFVESFRAAGGSKDPLAVLRQTALATLLGVDDQELAKNLQRSQLVITVPALRARSMDNTLARFDDAVRAFAESAGRPVDDPGVQAFVGACIGAFLPLILRWASGRYEGDLETLFDRSMAGLREIAGLH
jgi:AcrR family transcriptional regulator